MLARPLSVLTSLLAFAAGWLIVQGIAESLLGPMFSRISAGVGQPVPLYPFTMLIGAIGGCWAGFALPDFFVADRKVSVRFADRLAVSASYWRMKPLVSGVVTGSAAIGLTALVLWALGGLTFDAVPHSMDAMMSDSWSGAALRMLVVLAPAALWEELVYRGFLYDVALGSGGIQKARIVTSAAFGVSHLFNPGAGVRTTAIVMIAGWCLVLLREQWGLPAAWLAHLAWNWMMAAVLHVAVSGLPFSTPVYRAIPAGPEWLSGGTWGPEGGLIAAMVLGAGAIAGTYFAAKRARHAETDFSVQPTHNTHRS